MSQAQAEVLTTLLVTTNGQTSIIAVTDAASSSNRGNDGDSSNVGAIAGGTVGGAVALAILGACVWFFVSRRGKRKGATASAAERLSAQAAQQEPLQSHGREFEEQPVAMGDRRFDKIGEKTAPIEADHAAVRTPELEGDMYRPYRRS